MFIVAETLSRPLKVSVNGISCHATTFASNYQYLPNKANTPSNGGAIPWRSNAMTVQR